MLDIGGSESSMTLGTSCVQRVSQGDTFARSQVTDQTWPPECDRRNRGCERPLPMAFAVPGWMAMVRIHGGIAQAAMRCALPYKEVRVRPQVRAATPADLDLIRALLEEAVDEVTAARAPASAGAEDLARHAAALADLPGGIVVISAGESGPAGVLVGRLVPAGAFAQTGSLFLEAIYVAPGHRRHGVGHAMVEAALADAERAGAEHVYVTPFPSSRGVQRFFVRLGMSSVAGYRYASVSALRRRLESKPAGCAPWAAKLRRRRALAETGPVPVVTQDAGSSRMHVRRAVHSRRAAESSTTTS